MFSRGYGALCRHPPILFQNFGPKFHPINALGIALGGARHEDEIVGDDGAEVTAFEEFDLGDSLREEGHEGAAAALRAVVVYGVEAFGAVVWFDFESEGVALAGEGLAVGELAGGELGRPLWVAIKRHHIAVEQQSLFVARGCGGIAEAMDERVVVGEERLGERVAAGLFHVKIQHADRKTSCRERV